MSVPMTAQEIYRQVEDFSDELLQYQAVRLRIGSDGENVAIAYAALAVAHFKMAKGLQLKHEAVFVALEKMWDGIQKQDSP